MIGVEKFPCFAIDVKNIKPGYKVVFDDAATYYPVPLSNIERGQYNAHVVWDKNEGGRSISSSPGNIYSEPVKIIFSKNRNQSFNIVCKRISKKKPFIETQFIKELKAPSALLTAFYKRPTSVNAAVLLPKEYIFSPGNWSHENRYFLILTAGPKSKKAHKHQLLRTFIFERKC